MRDVKRVYDLAFIAAFGLAAFLVAWVVNSLVGMMSGENPAIQAGWGPKFFSGCLPFSNWESSDGY